MSAEISDLHEKNRRDSVKTTRWVFKFLVPALTNSGEKDRYTMGKHQKGMPGKGGSPVEYDWYADLFFLEEVYGMF